MRALAQQIESSPEYARWRTAERERRLAAIGAFLGVLDTMTGLPTSAVYKSVLTMWSGDHDYLQYLKTMVALVPRTGAVAKVITDAVAYTEKAREVSGVVLATVNANKGATLESLTAQATAQAKGAVLNTASRFALERVNRQLSFYKDSAEVDKVASAIGETELVTRAMPKIPGVTN